MKLSSIQTRVGVALHGDNRFCGASVGRSLAGTISLTQALLMAATTGRISSPEAARVVDDLQVCALAADPRIWPLKLARLGSTHGSSLAGVAVGLLGMESDDIGPWVAGRAAESLIAIQRDAPADDDALDAWMRDRLPTTRFHGFGVPFRKEDERVVAFERCLRAQGRESLPYWRLVRRVERSLVKLRALPLNIGGAAAAALLDAGLTPPEVQRVTGFGALASFVANAVEGAEQKATVLQCLPDEYVEYKGPPPRRSPRFREPT